MAWYFLLSIGERSLKVSLLDFIMNLDSLTCAAASEYVKYTGNIIYLCNCFDDYYKHRNFLIDHCGLTKKIPCAKSAMMINPQVRKGVDKTHETNRGQGGEQFLAALITTTLILSIYFNIIQQNGTCTP